MIEFNNDVLAKLKAHHSLLLKWQQSINLVGESTISDSWNRHFIDSAQLAKYITKPNPLVVDVGSGGGFPGMVLATMLEGEFHLVESDKKKCIFLSQSSRENFINVIIHNSRIESLSIPNVDYIISRACANISQIFSWTEKLQNKASHELKFIFLKGKKYFIELDEAKNEWHFDVEIHNSITDHESAILIFSHLQRRRKI